MKAKPWGRMRRNNEQVAGGGRACHAAPARSAADLRAFNIRRGALHPEKGAEIPRHHGTLAAAGVSVELQKRRRLEGEHRKARHQTVGKARAADLDRIWDAVETLSHRLGHTSRHREMLSEGFSVIPSNFFH